MKGLQHSVIEIKDPRNEDIDRILVFLKPGRSNIEIAGTRREAENILRKARVRRRLPAIRIKWQLAVALAVIFLLGAAVLMAAG